MAYLAQVVRVERTRIIGHTTTHEVSYAISRLPRTVADAARLLHICRAHWRIENGLHYRRDVTLQEDRSLVRIGHAPQVLAALNNLVCGMCVQAHVSNLAAFQRWVARRLDQWLDRTQVPHQHLSTHPAMQVVPHRR